MSTASDLEADVIVIGAGAGGGVVATALAQAGKSVIIIERGHWYDFEKDYPGRYPDWEKRGSPFRIGHFGSDPTIQASPGAAIASQDHDLCSRHDVKRIDKRNNRGSFNYSRVFGVGGTTLHYQGEAHRFPEHAFTARSRFGFGCDWPINYAQLEPYYDRIEKLLGVAGEPGNPYKSTRGPFPTPAHQLSTKSQWVRNGCEQLGWSLLPNTLALPSLSWGGRSPCRHSGMCTRGCPFGAKSSVDLAVLPTGLETGKLQVVTDCQVLQIETDKAGEVSAIVYQQDGTTRRAIASRYVLSAGAIETPRLLLASAGGAHPQGIGNQHDRVGRNLMETLFSILTVEADRPLQSWKGQPIDARVWDFNTPDRDENRNGFVLGVSSTMTGQVGPLAYVRRIGGSGKAHKDAMRNSFGRIVNLFGIAEHNADENNRLVLGDQTDKAGMPKVKVFSDYGELDRNTLRVMQNRLFELADACKAAELKSLYSTYDMPNASHLAGTCMMGNDPRSSVVDANGRVHGMQNLYIADASILPGQGMGDSPSLTIQSLALMIAGGME